ncbi:ABC transporter ATP-binding protein [Schleiferiaceae bacterium]|nr:ABC transporter ATP-binding protein [Schleiferiaceae bacterium]
MDNSLIYYLEGVSCKYKKALNSALEIRKLSIKRGDIVFFVGASGVGKSTLLETLGLMNNTVVENPESKFYFFEKSPSEFTDLIDLWKKSESALSHFRKNNLSFVFQTINMFNNLSAFENVCLARIIQNKSLDDSKLKARQIMRKLFNEEAFDEIIEGKRVFELSGGQRQRLAFIRAAATDYNVLLADEPTGNLDAHNADKLMDELVGKVKMDNKTAVVVTHDIPLAMKYGNQVVLLTKNRVEENTIGGEIIPQNIFNRHQNGWLNAKKNIWSSDEVLLRYLSNGLK